MKFLKIKTKEKDKEFENYVKFVVIEENKIVAISYAGNATSARALHASLYEHGKIMLLDENDKVIRVLSSSRDFKRIETMEGNIVHHTLLPTSAIDNHYQEALTQMVKDDTKLYPPRVVLAPKGNLIEKVGYFVAETFGLPKKMDWLQGYASILLDKTSKLEVITTDLAGDWQTLKAVKLLPMTEEDVLTRIEKHIKMGVLETRSTSVFGEGTFREDMSTEDYLRENALVLAKKLDVIMKPLTDGSNIDASVGELKRIPVPTQAKASVAALEVLKHKKGVFIVGDMGTGKTQMSLSSVYMQHKRRLQSGAKDDTRVLIVAPANVLPKWANLEIPKILPKGSYRTVMIRCTEDALKYVRTAPLSAPKGMIEFVLVSTDQMKYGPFGYVLGAKWDSHNFVWRSPDTNAILHKPNATKEERNDENLVIARWTDAVDKPSMPPSKKEIEQAKREGTLLPNGLPMGYVQKWSTNVRNFEENYETEKRHRSFARPVRKGWGETNKKHRWMIAQIFQRQLKNHFHLGIFDEVHQMRGSGSGRGLALHKIMKSVRKCIFLTGTLTNGAASSIQSLLWRAFPSEMLAHGISHNTSDIQFAQRYGVVEKVKKLDDKVTGTYTRKKENVLIKEKPGISPKLISDFLLDKCIFVELADLGVPLIELKEIPKIIQLDGDHAEEYDKFHRSHYNAALNAQPLIGTGAWAKFNPSTINYADQPQLGAYAEMSYTNKKGEFEMLSRISAPKFPQDYVTAKEREILADIEAELKENRHCIVFTHFTKEYRTNERLFELIKDRGFTCQILNEKVSVEKRVEWLEQQKQKGTQVLITNQRLVEVGLDLMDWPTIMFYQLNDDINVVRQASRRAWRLGQHRTCKVFYYVADKTTQLVQFQRLMSRRVSALIVEGRIERSDEIAKYADVKSGAVSDLSKMLSSVELTNAWVSASEKDRDTNLELLSEDVFHEKVAEAFKTLCAETIRVSGYVAPKVEPVAPVTPKVEPVQLTPSPKSVKKATILRPTTAIVKNKVVMASFESSFEAEQLSLFDEPVQLVKRTRKKSVTKKVVKTEQLSLFDL